MPRAFYTTGVSLRAGRYTVYMEQISQPTSQPRWIVVEFTADGPRTICNSADFGEASRAYQEVASGTWLEAHGRDAEGCVVVGQPVVNIFLGRKANGVEEVSIYG